MMKNKKILYLLVPAVVVVWGLVIYQIISHFQTPDFPITASGKIKITEQEILSPDTFKLLRGYGDPFRMGRRSVDSSEFSDTNKKTAKTSASPRQQRRYVRHHWAKVKYQGFIEGESAKIGLVTIGGKSYIVSENGVKKGYLIKYIAEDSIVLAYEKEERTFRK